MACASAGARPGLSSLRYLDTGDARIAALVAKIDKVLGRDVPILLLGETGTGKELLARAIHQDSPRRDGPFIAVDCASIPETLIEAELFGHAEGAFTGARKAGNPGKLAQAHGGTLFLDEIGDMPYALQTRLLRVLQERVVSPLGGGRPVPVDFSVICATHRNLRDSIAANRFREDLYYRINGLVLRLPALRERTDLDVIVRRILDAEHDEHLEVDPAVMALFRRHGWPGNLRQLTGLLRTAGLMAAGEGVIRAEHLSEDFLPGDLAPGPHEPTPDRAHAGSWPPDAGAANPCGLGAPVSAGARAQACDCAGLQDRASVASDVSGGQDAAAMAGANGAVTWEGPSGVVDAPAAAIPGDASGPSGAASPEPGRAADPPAGAQRLQDVQRSAIAAALDRHGGNVSAAAKALGVSRNTVYRRLGDKPAADRA